MPVIVMVLPLGGDQVSVLLITFSLPWLTLGQENHEMRHFRKKGAFISNSKPLIVKQALSNNSCYFFPLRVVVIPNLGMKYSHTGNKTFPAWE